MWPELFILLQCFMNFWHSFLESQKVSIKDCTHNQVITNQVVTRQVEKKVGSPRVLREAFFYHWMPTSTLHGIFKRSYLLWNTIKALHFLFKLGNPFRSAFIQIKFFFLGIYYWVQLILNIIIGFWMCPLLRRILWRKGHWIGLESIIAMCCPSESGRCFIVWGWGYRRVWWCYWL